MRITEIRYSYRRNAGNYQSEESSLAAELESGDDPVKAHEDLKARVYANLGMVLPVRRVEAPPHPATTASATTAATFVPRAKPAGAPEDLPF